MATSTDVAELVVGVETVSVAAAPRTAQHWLGYRLAAFGASEDSGKSFVIPLDEGLASHPAPVGCSSACQFQNKPVLEVFRDGLKQSREHLFGIGKTFFRVDGQAVLEEFCHSGTGSFAKPFITSKGPAERPAGQNCGEILVKYQPYGKAVAAVRGSAVGLLGRNISGCAVLVDSFHSPLDLQTDTKIAQCGPAIGKQKYVAWRDIAVYHAITVGIGQPVKHLCNYGEDSTWGHRFGAVFQSSDRQFSCQHGVPIDDVGVFDRHYVGMTQSGNEANFT